VLGSEKYLSVVFLENSQPSAAREGLKALPWRGKGGEEKKKRKERKHRCRGEENCVSAVKKKGGSKALAKN